MTTFPRGEKPEIHFIVRAVATPEDAAELIHGRDRTNDFTGDVRTLTVAGGGGRARDMERELLVWLPEGYGDRANRDRRYPVLYLMDGQNVFSRTPGLPGEWHADETATRLIAEGVVEPLIMVAVPNAGRMRMDEYLPFGDLPGAEPAGDEFVRWLAGTVMPAVEREFRVDHAHENVGIGGASLGGLIALYAGTAHGDTFGRVLVESCSKIGPTAEGDVRGAIEGAERIGRVYVGMGSREVSFSDRDTERNALYRDWAKSLESWLGDEGVGASDRLLVIGEGQHHHEPAWAERFEGALAFLFSAE
ncbi:MAG: alpha/beta hydrolase-fold protein [Planctomycetota bacterium]